MTNSLAVFEEHNIRRHYDEKTETWYFSGIDPVADDGAGNPQQTHRLLARPPGKRRGRVLPFSPISFTKSGPA